MAIFGLFGTKPKENSEMVPTEVDSPKELVTEPNDSTTDKEQEEKKRLITITWGTGMPIDVIFNFIHKNFEEDGFQDALINCDITYRDTKEKIIRNDLEMLFKRIILRYKNDIREVDVNINNAQKAYALTAASRLQARRETFEEHLAEINEMQEMLEKDDPRMLTMIESYRRGFQKGIAAVSIKFIENK